MEYVIDHASAAIVSVNAELDKLHFEDFGGIKAGAVAYLKQDVAAEIFNMASAARSYHDSNGAFDGFNPDVYLPLQTSAQMDAAIEANKALVIDHLKTIQPVVTIETPIEQFSLQENSELQAAGEMVSSLSGRPPNSSAVTYKVMYKDSSIDSDGSTLLYQGEFGELKLNPNTGSFVYSLNEQASSLNSGDVGVDSFSIAAIVDGYYSDPQAITITVAGDTDAVVAGNLSGAIAEDDNTAVVSGTLTISDPDIQDNPFFASGDYSGQYGSVNLDGSVWVYVLDQNSVQYLSEDQSVVDALEITASDGTSATVTVTITGTEDSPVISGDVTGSIVEASDSDANATINGSIQITDADSEDVDSISI